MQTFAKYLLIYLFLLGFVFRSLLLNITTNLIDWMDYPLMLWIMHQSISKILVLNFSNFFNSNGFYPYTNTLFFSDLLLPQALMALPFFAVTRNLILSFNVIFVITFILNYIGSYLLWKRLFKDNFVAFIGSLFLVFSPFFHLELSHFQMLSFWPMAFCLYFLLSQEFKIKRLILSGLFLSLQFLTSVYLAVFLSVIIIVFYFLQFLTLKKINLTFPGVSIVFITFLIVCLPFLKGYSVTKNMYNVTRDIREYIQYSAHLSDYLFTSNINSVIHKSPPINVWNSFNKHFIGVHSSFPGFLLFILALIGLFTITWKKRELLINLSLNQERAFFAVLLILGFVLSLGPRLNFNGNYAHIPLPFMLYKILPLLELTRVPARWSFIFFLAIIYFSLSGIVKLSTKFKGFLIIGFVLILFFMEYIPLNLETHAENYVDGSDQALNEVCSKSKKVLLEIPVTHLDAAPNVGVGLNYITKVELSSTYHNCFIVNGYSGFDLPELLRFRDQLYTIIQNEDTDAFLALIKENNIDIVKFNTEFFIEELKIPGRKLIEDLQKNPRVVLLDNTTFLIKN